MEVSSRLQGPDRSRSLFGRAGQSQGEDSGADEPRSRRKYQRTSNGPDDDSTFRKPIMPASAMKQNANSKPSLLQRKKSVGRENKPLHGPRPLENQSKRIFSEGSNVNDGRGPLLPTSSSMPVLERKNSAKHRFSLGGNKARNAAKQNAIGAGSDQNSRLPSSQSFAFLPPVSFDDFQSSIASYEKGLDSTNTSLPSIGHKASKDDCSVKENRINTSARSSRAGADSNPAISQPKDKLPSARVSGEHSFSIARKEVPPSPDRNSLAYRSRRVSALPTVSQPTPPSVLPAKSPRKSVGPGLLTDLLWDRQDQEPLPLSAPVQTSDSRASPVSRSRRRTLVPDTPTMMTAERSRATAPTRSSKAKSMLPPPRQPDSQATADPFTPAEKRQRARSSSRPAASRNAVDATTPGSSGNKRQSGRMSGLGARTISPTDARRLKRLSLMQPPLPKKPSPPPIHLEPMPDLRATAKSPSMIPRKMSLTPSSSRDTPESINQYHTSNTSLSRSSSYQSLRAVNNPGLPRMTQSPSSSRLPTPRTRNVYSSAETQRDEIVPPVPAIPKAYESPKDQIDTPFFSSSTTAFHEQPLSATSTGSESGRVSLANIASSRKPSLALPDQQNFSRPQPTSARPSIDDGRENVPVTPAPKKKSLHTMRLPPLSLQPLSTPTAAKIASIPHPSEELDQRGSTPPNRRNVAKTPSTPMTASKATFHKRFDDSSKPSYNLRSSTSHHALRGVDMSAFDQFANAVPMPMASNKRQITPFASGSLPKSGAEYLLDLDKPLPDEYSLGVHDVRTQASKPMGPRPRTVSTAQKDSSSTNTTSSTDDVDTPSSGNSLRRKFSLKWSRSASKTANRQQGEVPAEDSPIDFPKMPPPKLPASATWSELVDTGDRKTPTNATRRSTDAARRRPSQATLSSVTSDTAQVSAHGEQTLHKPSAADTFRTMHSAQATQQGPTPRSASWSVLGQGKQSTVGARSAQPEVRRKAPTVNAATPDKDDMAADEEMRRLALKRKDVESAARETDELKKQATPKPRLTPAQAIQTSAGVLNIYEKGEIIDYTEGVYFCGSKNARKHVGDISAAGTTNFGYDDERGDYNICMGDHLAYRYEVVDVLGKGSFGQVVRCIDHKHGGLVAVKIIRNKKRFHQQALVEVNILNKLREWDPDGSHATLTVTSSFYFRSHLCIVTPCLSINLYELIREHSFQGFSLPLIRRFARQLLSCLQLLQSKRIIHCDLKPENILLCDPRRADIRVIDFGSSCKTDEKVYTYIQSRFYRSPEVILGCEYGLGIDMWSFGCILAELYTGYPIFPGENEQEQLACIMEIFGPPSRDTIEKCSRRKLFFDSSWKPRVTVSSKGRRRRPSSKTLNVALKCDDDAFLDFITQCLRWDPERRLRPDQAISHPFIRNEPMRRTFERPRPRAANNQAKPIQPLGGIPSPTKRAAPSATAAVSSTAHTPKDIRARPLPQTPSTAIRNGVAVARNADTASTAATKASPLKTSGSVSRRQSSIPASVSAAGLDSSSNMTVANKRASNGFALGGVGGGGGLGSAAAGGSGLPRMASGRLGNGGGGGVDLAGAAARESMGIGSGGGRWR